MFNQNKSKVLYKATSNLGRAKALIVMGVILTILMICVMGFFASNSKQLSRELGDSITIVWIFLVILLVDGIGYLLQGAYMTQVSIVVYEEGITGNAMYMNPFIPILTKQLPFDMKFNDITAMRFEGNFFIYQNAVCYTLPISKADADKVQELVLAAQEK